MAVTKNGPATKKLLEKSKETAEREANKTVHPMVGMLRAGYVQKDKQNTHFKYRYASDEAVSKLFRETMRENGVYVSSFTITTCDVGQRGNKHTCLIIGEFRFRDSDGNEYGPYAGAGSAEDVGDKYAMKALTAARKYALAQACLISWGDDDPEADETTDTMPAGTEPPPAQNPAPTTDEIEAAKRLLGEESLFGIKRLQELWKNEITKHIKAYIAEVDREWWDATKKAAKDADATRAKQDNS